MGRSQYAARTHARRSMSETLEQVAPEPVAPTAPPGPSLEVGAADAHAEREADAIAEQVLGRLADKHEHAPGCGHDGGGAVRRTPAGTTGTTGTIGAAGGELDGGSSATIESARGGGSPLDAGVRREMETGFGRGLGNVRIHTDGRADQLSRQMSARAFTTGQDIFFARGEYDPTSASGRHTLAHELAHTTQESGTTTRRKMRGTAEALENQGGGTTSGKFRKAIGLLTNWDSLVTAVRAYEAQEDKLLSSGKNPDQMTLTAAKPGMLKHLKKAQDAVKDWKKSNKHDDETAKGEKKAKDTKEKGDDEVTDTRTKAGRRQAVAMVEPRLGNEFALLSGKDSTGWLSSLGLSSKQVQSTGDSKSGQMNTVSKLNYKTEGGEFSGYFKEDKGVNAKLIGHEEEAGITHVDPNYGARSVALYRLDQLFDAQVTARAEFAVHTNKQGKSVMGTVLEAAKGKEGGDLAFRIDGEAGGNGKVNLDDPVLQRGLNKLQLLDAISGQLDRHMGNYYVDSDDQGNVTGVTGIDLDMAFGKNMATTKGPDGAHNYKGLPEFIDKAMGEKILAVKATDVRNALLGLLSKSEIEATVSRFTEVQEAVREARKAGKLVDKWDPSTSKAGAKAGSEYADAKNYHSQARDVWYGSLNKVTNDEIKEALADHFGSMPGWTDMPDKFYAVVRRAFSLDRFWKDKALSPVTRLIADALFEAHASESKVPEAVDVVLVSVLTSIDENKLAVELQECFTAMDEAKLVTKTEQGIAAHLAKNKDRLGAVLASIVGKK